MSGWTASSWPHRLRLRDVLEDAAGTARCWSWTSAGMTCWSGAPAPRARRRHRGRGRVTARARAHDPVGGERYEQAGAQALLGDATADVSCSRTASTTCRASNLDAALAEAALQPPGCCTEPPRGPTGARGRWTTRPLSARPRTRRSAGRRAGGFRSRSEVRACEVVHAAFDEAPTARRRARGARGRVRGAEASCARVQERAAERVEAATVLHDARGRCGA